MDMFKEIQLYWDKVRGSIFMVWHEKQGGNFNLVIMIVRKSKLAIHGVTI